MAEKTGSTYRSNHQYPCNRTYCDYGRLQTCCRSTTRRPGCRSHTRNFGKPGQSLHWHGGVPWVCAHNTPAASAPFGMARPGPDTASLFINHEAFNYSGYYYGDNKIIGFSNTRLPGTGGVAGGNLRVFPTMLKKVPTKRMKNAFCSVFP